MPFCRMCGAEAGEEVRFCRSCGAPLPSSGQGTDAGASAAPQERRGGQTSLWDELIAASAVFPAALQPQKDGCLAMEALVAERKAFLSTRKLSYKCKLRVDDGARSVVFWEMLVEKGSGVSGGDDLAPGFGFKKETYSTGGKGRSGSIEEVSSLFGRDFDYTWDYAAVRLGDLWGYISTNGGWAIEPRFHRVSRFSKGPAAVQLEPGGRYGYIDEEGSYVIEPQFADAEPFIGSLALVELGTGSWAYVDLHGVLVFESAAATGAGR